MRNLLALFALALLVFAGVGWFRDWYQIKTGPADLGHQSVNIDIHGAKILSDVEKGIQKLEEKKQELGGDGAAAEVGPPAPKATAAQTPVAPKTETP